MYVTINTVSFLTLHSMDGFRVVKLDGALPFIDILITATGTCGEM